MSSVEASPQGGVVPRRGFKKVFTRAKKQNHSEMSLVEHLQELRRRVIISVFAVIVTTIIGFIWYQHVVNLYWFSIPSLGDILRGPYCDLPPQKRADLTHDGTCRLIATAPFEMFMLRLKVGALAGLVFASPIWLYQIWAFITPGLMKNERRWTFSFVSIAVLLFIFGAVLAYFVLDYGLEFLLGIGDDVQTAALSGDRYFSFILALLAMFGVSFEVPLIIAMLNIVGVLPYEVIKDKRRIITVVLFIFAAFMTPGQDPFSMLALGVSLTLLVEVAMQFARINDKRRNVSRPSWMDLDDESASPLDLHAGGVDSPNPVTASGPVSASSTFESSSDINARPITRPAPLKQTKPLDSGTNFDDVL